MLCPPAGTVPQSGESLAASQPWGRWPQCQSLSARVPECQSLSATVPEPECPLVEAPGGVLAVLWHQPLVTEEEPPLGPRGGDLGQTSTQEASQGATCKGGSEDSAQPTLHQPHQTGPGGRCHVPLWLPWPPAPRGGTAPPPPPPRPSSPRYWPCLKVKVS